MFKNVLRSPSTTTAVMAGAAAAFTGSTLLSNQKTETVSECSDNTIVGLLQGLTQRVSNIEAVLGASAQKQKPAPTKKTGIDVVLGAQWGDEGKGKLVDMLSQVRPLSPFAGIYEENL
jgi:hypothetical protein